MNYKKVRQALAVQGVHTKFDLTPSIRRKSSFARHARRLLAETVSCQIYPDMPPEYEKHTLLLRKKRLTAMAYDAFDNGDYKRSKELLDRALSQDPRNSFAIALLISLHFRVREEEKAVRLFEKHIAHPNKYYYRAFILGCANSCKQMWEIAEKAFLDAQANWIADSEMGAGMIHLLSVNAPAIGYSVALEKGEKIFNESSLLPDAGVPRARGLLCLRLLRLYRICCVNGLSEGVVVKAANLLSEMRGLRQKMEPFGGDCMPPEAFVLFLDVLRNAYKRCDKNSILGLAEEAYENAHRLGLATTEVTEAFKFFQERNTEKSGQWPGATAKSFRLQPGAV